jgi:hypothetical protein
MIQVAGQRKRFHLQMTIGFDVIHKFRRPCQSFLQPSRFKLSGPLQPPEGIGHFREHQLWSHHKIRLQQRFPQDDGLRRPLP